MTTEQDVIQIQIENARKAAAHHAQFAAQYAEMARLSEGFEQDEYRVQADFHTRQAAKWETRLRQLGVKI